MFQPIMKNCSAKHTSPTWKAGRYRALSGGLAASPCGPTLRAATSSPSCSGSTPVEQERSAASAHVPLHSHAMPSCLCYAMPCHAMQLPGCHVQCCTLDTPWHGGMGHAPTQWQAAVDDLHSFPHVLVHVLHLHETLVHWSRCQAREQSHVMPDHPCTVMTCHAMPFGTPCLAAPRA